MRAAASALVLVLVLLVPGCLTGTVPAGTVEDAPSVRPSEVSGFHDPARVAAVLGVLAAHPSGVATPFELGTSVEGRPIPGLVLTAPGDASQRIRVLVDGGIHGNEVHGAEAALYLAAWLVENHGRNRTATRILEEAVVHVVPTLNPDGRAAMARQNANGVDLNRNFDVDFGNPSPLCRSNTVSPLLPYYYAGPRPLSEPETRALAERMADVEPQIYLSHHTGRHALIRPWAACEPPHPMPSGHDAVFEAVEAWTRANTPYRNTGTAEETAERAFPPGAASGSSMDWAYLAHGAFALTLEVTEEYGEVGDPTRWSEEVLPISIHVLQNAAAYAAWRIPDAARAS